MSKHSIIRSNRPLLDERNLRFGRYDHPQLARRRAILRETLDTLSGDYDHYHRLAQDNLERWAAEREARGERLPSGQVEVIKGDWGDVTLALTKRWGVAFPVLNMANAYVAGGAYLQGTSAQEENMFRRTDCHLALKEEELQPYDRHDHYVRYRPEVTALLEGEQGRVSLDMDQLRVCVRGSEKREEADLGYPWLSEEDVFPFYELKAAAMDLRDGAPFDPVRCALRFNALLDTLKDAGQRVAVLGAHGCGAFLNPSERVADCFAQVLDGRREDFDLIVFAIFHAGYGPSNFEPFFIRFSVF